jgi:hypothetical protein
MVLILSDLIVGIGLLILAYLIYRTTRSRTIGLLVGILGLAGIYLITAGLGLVPAIIFND